MKRDTVKIDPGINQIQINRENDELLTRWSNVEWDSQSGHYDLYWQGTKVAKVDTGGQIRVQTAEYNTQSFHQIPKDKAKKLIKILREEL